MTVGQSPGIVKSAPWRACVVGYLLWLIAFAVVDGTGRQVCRMPMQKWIDAAATSRDREARVWFRDRATECLHLTRWYSYSVAGLVALGLISPAVVVWITRRRARWDPGPPRPASDFKTAAAVCAVALVMSLAAVLGTMMAVRWAYDHLG